MDCPNIQKSLPACPGKPAFPGIRRRLYYIASSLIVAWPERKRNTNGTYKAEYNGSFTLAADATFKYIDVIVSKSGLTSDPIGEQPSQLQQNKLTAVHPGVGKEATEASNYFNNSDNVYLVQDMEGNWRVLGSELYESVTTYKQDLGQGSTGNAASTIEVEAVDATPAPFYYGEVVAEDGTFMADGSAVEGSQD